MTVSRREPEDKTYGFFNILFKSQIIEILNWAERLLKNMRTIRKCNVSYVVPVKNWMSVDSISLRVGHAKCSRYLDKPGNNYAYMK